MPPIHRILIRTHHMTSRKKILAISNAAKRLSCSVLLKTGRPPGIMLAESEDEGALEWLEVVKKLRYKDYNLRKNDVAQKKGLDIEPGVVMELTSMKEFGGFLERDEEIFRWWKIGMGFMKDEDAP